AAGNLGTVDRQSGEPVGAQAVRLIPFWNRRTKAAGQKCPAVFIFASGLMAGRPLSPSLTRIRDACRFAGFSLNASQRARHFWRVHVTNGDRWTRLTIEGVVPVLRDEDIMTARPT
ncbi:MAG: hypothetical protein WA776_11415, partial [Xanthobacteraceae bacterium]